MNEFDNQGFLKAIYDAPQEVLIAYLDEHRSLLPKDKAVLLISTVFQRKKWEVFDYLVDRDMIHTDLFEYDSFDDNVLRPFFTHVKYLNENDLAEFLPHFINFLGKIDDVNEELAGANFLAYAIGEGMPVGILQALIDSGIRMDFRTRAEENYLHLCCKYRQPDQLAYTASVIQLLLDNGVDLNQQSIEGKAPLTYALENYNLAKPEIIQSLLDQGADVNSADKMGITPVFVAAVHLQNLRLVNLLLQYGTPDFDKTNRDGENLLNGFLRMMSNNEDAIAILHLLLASGASLNARSQYYGREKSGVDWVAEKHSDIMKRLLDNGSIDLNGTDNDGQTLLIKVCKIDANHEESVAKDLYRKVRNLLKAGALPDVEDRFDKKAVDYAMSDNMKTKIVETLLEK